ncbi:MAG: response regulator [Leptospiraceae bacterium]|nr:response regulator [Leptospiraceae bacterium]
MAKSIMVIDDSASIRQVLNMILSKEGFTVIEAVDGADALAKLPADSSLNLIICDVNMPNINGIEFVIKLKANPDHKFTPVIMLTTESEEEMKIKGMEAGAKAWLVKPFHPSQLMDAVNKLVH